jgi:hypothetical protein
MKRNQLSKECPDRCWNVPSQGNWSWSHDHDGRFASILGALAAMEKRKVVVWSEGTANVDEQSKKVYPQDINTAIAEGLAPLSAKGWDVIKASINDPEPGDQ